MQGKYNVTVLSDLLSLADCFDEKEGTTILERVAFLLRLSIYKLINPYFLDEDENWLWPCH